MGRSRMIFKDLENCIKDLRVSVKTVDLHDKDSLRLEKTKLTALLKVAEYVDSCDWLVKEEAKEKLRFIRASKYNYKLVQQELNLTEDAVKSFMKYCIARLKDKIGETTIDLIMDGNIRVGIVQFETLRGTYSMESMFNPDVLDKLPKSDFNPDVLLNCKKEISFLFDYSKEEMQKRYEDLDKDKLAFIRYILEKNTPKFTEDKYDLVRLFTGNGGGKEEYFKNLEDKSTYRP